MRDVLPRDTGPYIGAKGNYPKRKLPKKEITKKGNY
jgi:hypothetical protein